MNNDDGRDDETEPLLDVSTDQHANSGPDRYADLNTHRPPANRYPNATTHRHLHALADAYRPAAYRQPHTCTHANEYGHGLPHAVH